MAYPQKRKTVENSIFVFKQFYFCSIANVFLYDICAQIDTKFFLKVFSILNLFSIYYQSVIASEILVYMLFPIFLSFLKFIDYQQWHFKPHCCIQCTFGHQRNIVSVSVCSICKMIPSVKIWQTTFNLIVAAQNLQLQMAWNVKHD